MLASGSRKSGKTWAVLHRIVRHLWETPGARVGIFAKSKGLAKDGGVWSDLLNIILPEWFAAGIGIEYTTKDSKGVWGPIADSTTRTNIFRVRNYYKGESEVMLFSIDNDEEVASKVKQKRFSLIYFPELSMFKSPRILSVTMPQLRMPHLKPEQHMWIADTNPDEDLGNRSWFYKEFYVERNKKRDESNPREAKRAAYYKRMAVIEMFMHDNPLLSAMEKDELEISCEGDQALYDSYVLGIHGEAGKKMHRHFSSFFNRNVHIVGSNDSGQAKQIEVSPNTTTLYTGWDIGQVYHAAFMLQKRLFRTKDPLAKHGYRFITIWDVLDEVVALFEKLDLKDLGAEMAQKMETVEQKYARRFQWVHYCDDSATTQWRPSSASYDYQEIIAGSNGRIQHMQGVAKPDGSVRVRAKLLKRLLREQRIYFSICCPYAIQVMEECKKGDKESEYILEDDNIHGFSALSYPIYAESLDELSDLMSKRPATADQNSDAVDIVGVG